MQDSTEKIKHFCKYVETRLITTKRHEMEHARKAALVNKPTYSNITRARVEILNEMVSCAAEIIAAMDYEYDTGHKYPGLDNLTRPARAEIISAMKTEQLQWPVDFNNPKIADITIRHASNYFIRYSNLYRKAIYNKLTGTQKPYTPNDHCETIQYNLFHPELNIWAPLWQFETRRGIVNLWLYSSEDAKNRLLSQTDSVVMRIAGQNTQFLKKPKMR